MGCWIYTSNFFHHFLVWLTDIPTTIKCSLFSNVWLYQVREVFMIHVGGTRCVTSRTDNNIRRLLDLYEHVFIFISMFEHKDEYDLTLFSMLLSGPVELLRPFECVWTDGTWSLYHTCRWYSLCNFQYRPHSEHTCSDHFDCWMYTNLSFWILMCQYKDEYDTNLFSMWLIFSWPDCCGNGVRVCRTGECTWSLCYTCWWYSLCNFQYRQHYEKTRIALKVEFIRTCIFLFFFDV